MINVFLEILKWPMALLAVVSFPAILAEFYRIVCFLFYHRSYYLFLYIGFGSYWCIWYLFRGKNWGVLWFSTLEHEITHALFALATFNRVVGIKVSWQNGGSMQYQGRGNWLITIAPYFFPTFAFATVLAGIFLHKSFLVIIMTLTGFFISYHIHSTWKETHTGQSDIQKVGVLYSCLFLPSANLLSFLLVLTLLPLDKLYISLSLQQIYSNILIHNEKIISFIK